MISLKFVTFLILIVAGCNSSNTQSKKKIIFFGDSITELAVKPEGFITILQQKLQQENKSNKYELIGAGVSSNKVYDLYLRLDEDVLARKPDAVVIWIGVNDVWHKRLMGTGTDADKFEKFYQAILNKLKQNNIAIYLCTPAVIGEKTDYTNEQDGEMNLYSNIVRTIAERNNCTLIDLRKAFLDYGKKHNGENKSKGILTYDGVHLNDNGNQFVAAELYRVLSGSFFK
ncbi:MAG: G-D-S-L family lipolytic protein [Chitinophagaceae bacterium]|nr:G-D-S-L family lipolytic protein [Chitinophagaceae bacterium]